MMEEDNILHTLSGVNEATDTNFRKWKLYDMEWTDRWSDADLDAFTVVGAPFGGPVAVAKAFGGVNFTTKPKEFENSELSELPLSECLCIYSCTGMLLAKIPWQDKRAKGMGWTAKELLIVVLENGTCEIYNLHGELKYEQNILALKDKNDQFRLKPEEQRVKECKIGPSGVIILTPTNQLVTWNLQEREKKKWIYYNQNQQVRELCASMTAMAYIDPTWNIDKNRGSVDKTVEVLIATSDRNIYVVHFDECSDFGFPLASEVKMMEVQPSIRQVACMQDDGVLAVISLDTGNRIFQVSKLPPQPPQQLLWCGEDSIILSWRQRGLLMVGKHTQIQNKALDFSYDTGTICVQEVDCCRVITAQMHEMIQKRPSVIERIKSIASTDPAAILCEALDAYESMDARANEIIMGIVANDQLHKAVNYCIEAACVEFDVGEQKRMLAAARHGMNFYNAKHDPETFVTASKKLRVLNNVRDPANGIAMPITSRQYDLMTPKLLVNRLVMRKKHFMASRLCEHLDLPDDEVLVDWACEKIRTDKSSDDELQVLIKSKFSSKIGVSFSEISRHAIEAERKKLAVMLLDDEPRITNQVRTLLEMREFGLAMQRAIASGDTDLIYLVLLYSERFYAKEKDEFHKVVLSYPESYHLLASYYQKRGSVDKLRSLHEKKRAYFPIAANAVTMGFEKDKMKDRIEYLNAASEFFQGDKDLHFQAKMTEEHVMLLREQEKLNRELEGIIGDLRDMSLMDTIYDLCAAGIGDSRCLEFASNLARKFKAPEKMYYHQKAKALAQSNYWEELHRFSNERKSPIGYAPFAKYCLDRNNKQEATRYVDRIVDNDDRFKILLELGDYLQAAEVAIKMKSLEYVGKTRNDCQGQKNGPQLQRQIEEMARAHGLIK